MLRDLMRLAAILIVVLSVPVVARAQEARGTRGEALPIDATEELLLLVAGDGAEVVRSDDGTVRALLGARIAGMGAPRERAVGLLTRFARVFGLPPDVRFDVLRELDAHGLHTVRLSQTIAGVRVLGSQAAVRFAPDATIDHVVVSPAPAVIAVGARRLTGPAEAGRAALALSPQGHRVTEAQPYLFPIDGELVPAWAVEVENEIATSLELVLLDARSGAPIVRIPRVLDARGNVFANNPATDMDVTSEVELTDLTGARLTGRYVRVASCNAQSGTGCAETAYATPDAMGDFLYAPATTRAFDDAFSEVNAYHHVNRVAAYFRTMHGFTWTCGASTTMDVVVNYSELPGVPYDNAAYSPGGRGCGFLLFGEGATGDFAYDGDVVYHEYGHAVTDVLTDILGFANNTLGVHYLPLAINEGTSDYWAGTLQGDPDVAESFADVTGLGGHGSLRVIDNELRCPNDLIGEGHFDGRIHGAMVWDLRTAIGAEDADAILFASLPTFLSDVDLSASAAGLRATAMTLASMGTVDAGAPAALEAIITARGLTDCERIVPLDDAMPHQGYSGSQSITGSLGRRIAPNHYRIDVPADATELRVFIGRLTFAGSYTLHVRPDLPVRVASRIVSSYSAPIGNRGELVLNDASEYVLPRCQTLYIAVQVDDLTSTGESLYSISGTLTRSGDPEARCPELPDAGSPGGDAGTSADGGTVVTAAGCGCSAGRGPAPSLGLALLAVALWSRRRGLQAGP